VPDPLPPCVPDSLSDTKLGQAIKEAMQFMAGRAKSKFSNTQTQGDVHLATQAEINECTDALDSQCVEGRRLIAGIKKALRDSPSPTVEAEILYHQQLQAQELHNKYARLLAANLTEADMNKRGFFKELFRLRRAPSTFHEVLYVDELGDVTFARIEGELRLISPLMALLFHIQISCGEPMTVTTTVPWERVRDKRCPFIYMMGTYPPLVAMALLFGEEALGVFIAELFIKCGCKDFRDGGWSLKLRDVFPAQKKNLYNMGLDHAPTQQPRQSSIETVMRACPRNILGLRLEFMELEALLIKTLREGTVTTRHVVIPGLFCLITKSTWRAPCL